MKIISATELLVKKSKDRNKKELQDLMEIILLENNEEWFKNKIWMDELENILCLNVDEISFNLNGLPLEDWLRVNTDCDVNSDKRWRVFGINRQ